MPNKNSKINTVLIVVLVVLVGYFVLSKHKANAPTSEMPVSTPREILVTGKADKSDLISFTIARSTEVTRDKVDALGTERALVGKMDAVGVIKGGYFFEGNIVVNILDKDKKLLRAGHGEATTDWMTSGPVSFKATIDASGLPGAYGGPGYIEIRNDNPSGLPENDKSILIPVTIL